MSGSWSNPIGNLIILETGGGGFSGLFIYDPAPGPGALVESIAASAGVDPYGNAYAAGFTTYDNVNSVFAELAAGSVKLGQIVSGAADTADAADIVQEAGVGLRLRSFVIPASPVGNDRAVVELLAGGTGKPTGSAQTTLLILRDDAASSALDTWITGNVIKAGSLHGQSAQQWLSVANTTLTLGTGWATNTVGGGAQPVEVRQDVEDNLVITGTVHSTSNAPANDIFILSAPYVPAVLQRCIALTVNGGVNTVNRFNIATNGAVTLATPIAAANTDVYFNITVPLGNIS